MTTPQASEPRKNRTAEPLFFERAIATTVHELTGEWSIKNALLAPTNHRSAIGKLDIEKEEKQKMLEMVVAATIVVLTFDELTEKNIDFNDEQIIAEIARKLLSKGFNREACARIMQSGGKARERMTNAMRAEQAFFTDYSESGNLRNAAMSNGIHYIAAVIRGEDNEETQPFVHFVDRGLRILADILSLNSDISQHGLKPNVILKTVLDSKGALTLKEAINKNLVDVNATINEGIRAIESGNADIVDRYLLNLLVAFNNLVTTKVIQGFVTRLATHRLNAEPVYRTTH